MYNVLPQALTCTFLFLSLMWDRCNILHFSFLRERWGREKGKRPSRWGLALHELRHAQLPWTPLRFQMSQTMKVYSSNRSSTWLFQNIIQGSCCPCVVLASHDISPVLKSHLHTGFAASGGQGRSENAASELLYRSHKSLFPWGLISQSKSPDHGWHMSWILHMVSEGRGMEHIIRHLWHLLLLAKWGEQSECEGYVPWLWVRPECGKDLGRKTRSKLGVVGSIRCHRVRFTTLQTSNKDSMNPHSVFDPTLVPLFYTAPNPCQSNSRSYKF